MTTGISAWRERADRMIGRCPTCDHYTWRDHCPGCESDHPDQQQDQRREQS